MSKLLKGTIYLTISSYAFVISSFIVNFWLGRFLGPEGYGFYGVIISLMGTINLTQTAGLPQAIAKYVSEDESRTDDLLRSGLLVQITSTICIAVALYFFSDQISLLFRDISLSPYIKLVSLIFPLYGIYSLYLNLYNGQHEFKRQSYMSLLYAISKTVSIVILAYFLRVYGVILGFILSPLIALVFYIKIPRMRNSFFPLKKLLIFSAPLIVLSIFSMLLQNIDLFFVKSALHSNKLAGYYVASQNISLVPFYGIISIGTMLFPSVARIIAANHLDEAKKLINNSLRMTLIILIPIISLISATSGSVLSLLYSSKYLGGASALAILVFGIGFFTIFSILTSAINGYGKPQLSALFLGVGVFTSILLCSYLVPVYGIVGAAISTTTAAALILAVAFIYLKKSINIDFPYSSISKIITASAVLYFVARLVQYPIFLYPLFILIMLGVYVLLLYLLGEIRAEDKHIISRILPKRIKEVINLS